MAAWVFLTLEVLCALVAARTCHEMWCATSLSQRSRDQILGKQRKTSRHGVVVLNQYFPMVLWSTTILPSAKKKQHAYLPSASTWGHCTLRSPSLHKSMFDIVLPPSGDFPACGTMHGASVVPNDQVANIPVPPYHKVRSWHPPVKLITT